MNELSMIMVLACVAFFIFVAICVFAYYNKKRTSLSFIIISSGLYTLSLNMFYIDVKFMLDGHLTFYIPFITFLLILISLIFFIRAIADLNKVPPKFPLPSLFVFSITMASLLGYTTYIGSLLSRAIIFYVGISIPLAMALYYYHKSKLTASFNLIAFQIYLIYLLIVANTIQYLFYPKNIYFTNPPSFVIAYLMIINVLILTSIFSFIVERSKFDLIELEEKSVLLENMFHTVKKNSETDELTEAYNRRKINEVLSILYKNFLQENVPFSLLLLDIDKFKSINDSYGHATGDDVLKHVTTLLGNATRDTDFLGRWGGDEFLIILSNTKYENCIKVATKIKTMDKNYTSESISIDISLSVGCMQSQEDLSIDELIHQADLKLYEDKKRKNLIR